METEKLSQLENQANAKLQNKDPFMPDSEKPKPRKGRPPKSSTVQGPGPSIKPDPNAELKAQIKAIPTKELCVPLALGVSGFCVNMVGHEKAAMNKDESEAFCIGLSMIIDKYMPNAMDKYGPEIVFAAFLTQYGVRLYALKKVLTLEKQQGPQNMPSKESTEPKSQPTPEDIPSAYVS